MKVFFGNFLEAFQILSKYVHSSSIGQIQGDSREDVLISFPLRSAVSPEDKEQLGLLGWTVENKSVYFET